MFPRNMMRIPLKRAFFKHAMLLLLFLFVILVIVCFKLNFMISSSDWHQKISPRFFHLAEINPINESEKFPVDNKDEPVVHRTKSDQSASHNSAVRSEMPNTGPIARQQKIREMTAHAWKQYKEYAWGQNELRPITKQGFRGAFGGDLGVTIIDGLDTLYIMNLTEQYQEGRNWVAEHFTLENKHIELSVFETTIRFLGSFLTMYAFTGDSIYKTKAKEVADKLLPAFETKTGIPNAIVNIGAGTSKNYGWAYGDSLLAELGTLHLEFAYLSDITGKPDYRERVEKIHEFLRDVPKVDGLYQNFINPESGRWGKKHVGMGAYGDSFYEYLLKIWIQSNKTDADARKMYDDAMAPVVDHLVRKSSTGLTYVTDLSYGNAEVYMDHLTCFSGGLFALGAATKSDENSERYMQIGKDITSTCHESYIRTATQLGPDRFRFDGNLEAQAAPYDDRRFLLRPEVIESYFVLWRLTHDQKYRDWGWDAVEAIEKYCKTPTGYSGIKDVYSRSSGLDDVQQSFFLAEVLKYLYLLFSDDSLLPLNEWVFNTEAHPLPIQGNPKYRQSQP